MSSFFIGDEAGTTEGNFNVQWKGDFYYAKNLAVKTTNNSYLDGLGAMPENAVHHEKSSDGDEMPDNDAADEHIYLWMSDYHPGEKDLYISFVALSHRVVICL